MESLLRISYSGRILDWDETVFNSFYYIYDIESGPGNSSSTVQIGKLRNTSQTSHTDFNALYRLYIEGFGGIFITLLGVLGNTLSAWIFSRPKMLSPINTLLIGLAFADTGFIFTHNLITALPVVLAHWNIDISIFAIITFFTYPIVCTAHFVSIYLTIAVTLERYFAVYYPIQARSDFTLKHAVCTILIICITSILYNLPKWWEFQILGIMDETNTLISYVPVTTALQREPIYEKFYGYLSYFLFVYSIPIVVLVVFNALICKEIRKANLNRRRMNNSDRNENQISQTLVVVVAVFILCNSVVLLNIAARFISGSPNLPTVVDSETNFLFNVNSCINFVIYYICGKKFRDAFNEMLPNWAQHILFKRELTSGRSSYCQSNRSNI